MTEQIERRVIEGLTLERAEGDKGKMPTIRGYAAVFNKLSVDLGGFREKVAPGAFEETIKADDVRALVDHEPGKLIGRKSAKTLDLAEDATGLAIAIRPPNTTAGRDVVESIERGDLTGMSFSFRTIKDLWETVNGEQIRTLLKVALREVSPAAFPAYPDTSVACRSLDAHKQNEIKRETDAWAESVRTVLKRHKGATPPDAAGQAPPAPSA